VGAVRPGQRLAGTVDGLTPISVEVA